MKIVVNEENIGLEIAKEAIKEIGKDVYTDGGQPIVKPTGELIGLIPRAIKAALFPLEKWILQREYNLAEVKQLLEVKHQNTDPDLIEAPEAYIAVPALQYISYCMDNDELRDMYANLLANSMNKVVKNGVHPGFVEIIKQLSPDEAKLMKYVFNNEFDGRIPVVSFVAHKHTEGFAILIKNFTNATELCGCEKPEDYEKYIDNLIRLGLMRCSNNEFLVDDSIYVPLENHSVITDLKKQIKDNPEIDSLVESIELQKRFLELTSFGKSFCLICLEVQNVIED